MPKGLKCDVCVGPRCYYAPEKGKRYCARCAAKLNQCANFGACGNRVADESKRICDTCVPCASAKDCGKYGTPERPLCKGCHKASFKPCNGRDACKNTTNHKSGLCGACYKALRKKCLSCAKRWTTFDSGLCAGCYGAKQREARHKARQKNLAERKKEYAKRQKERAERHQAWLDSLEPTQCEWMIEKNGLKYACKKKAVLGKRYCKPCGALMDTYVL